MIKSIKIDLEKCVGCGACAAIAPDVFEIAQNGQAKLKKNWRNTSLEVIKQGAESCPMEAIKIEK